MHDTRLKWGYKCICFQTTSIPCFPYRPTNGCNAQGMKLLVMRQPISRRFQLCSKEVGTLVAPREVAIVAQTDLAMVQWKKRCCTVSVLLQKKQTVSRFPHLNFHCQRSATARRRGPRSYSSGDLSISFLSRLSFVSIALFRISHKYHFLIYTLINVICISVSILKA
jgi:hypothetical protein